MKWWLQNASVWRVNVSTTISVPLGEKVSKPHSDTTRCAWACFGSSLLGPMRKNIPQVRIFNVRGAIFALPLCGGILLLQLNLNCTAHHVSLNCIRGWSCFRLCISIIGTASPWLAKRSLLYMRRLHYQSCYHSSCLL
jgi:hypothetical protein